MMDQVTPNHPLVNAADALSIFLSPPVTPVYTSLLHAISFVFCLSVSFWFGRPFLSIVLSEVVSSW